MSAPDDILGIARRLHATLCGSSGFAPGTVQVDRIATHLRARMQELRIDHAAAIEARLAADPAELALLEQAFSPAETWLFRYPESFALLRAHAARLARKRTLRAISLGCGGWSEPCSIAAAMIDGAAPHGSGDIEVLAVDRNPMLLASEPLFAGLALRGGIPAWATRLFAMGKDRGHDIVRPNAEIVRSIRRDPRDAERVLAELQSAGAAFDAVFFRNAAIYLDDAVRRRLFRAAASVVAEGGLLFVGHAEVEMAAGIVGLDAIDAPGAFALLRPSRGGGDEPLPRRVSSERRRDRPGKADASALPAASRFPTPHSSPYQSPDPMPSRRRDAEPASGADAQAPPEGGSRLPSADPAIHLQEALAHEASGDRARAEQSVARALYLDRNCEEALVIAARLADARGAHGEADRLRERALRAHLGRHAPGQRGSGPAEPGTGAER